MKEEQAYSGFSWAIAEIRNFRSLSNIKSIPKYALAKNYYVGLDVHKKTISRDYALAGSREGATYHGQCYGSIPTVLDEAVRDVCRVRSDAKDDLIRAKQRPNALLLCNGFHYTGKSKWTIAHMRYLRELAGLSSPSTV